MRTSDHRRLRWLVRPRRAALAASGLAVALLVGACGSSTTPSGTSNAAGSQGSTAPGPAQGSQPIVMAQTTDPTSYDPQKSTQVFNQNVIVNTYQTLVGYPMKPDANGDMVSQGLDVSPMLAESWKADGPTITFKLRSDVKFYPSGNPLTSADVVYSMERSLNLFGRFDAAAGGIFKADQVKAVDDHTVSVTFVDADGKPTASVLGLPTFRASTFSIVDSKVVKSHATKDDPWAANWLQNNIAGTGPYYVKSRQPGQQINLEAVPGVTVDVPKASKVTIQIASAGGVSTLLRGGQVNFAEQGLTTVDYQSLSNADRVVHNTTTPTTIFLSVPIAADQITKDVKVRQAIAMAVPYDQIISTVYHGQAARSLSIVNPDAENYTPAWEQYKPDLNAAKALVQQAGLSDAAIKLSYQTGDPNLDSIALLIKNNLAQVGISVTLNPQQPTALRAITDARKVSRKDKGSADSSAPGGMVLAQNGIFLSDAGPAMNLYGVTDGVSNYGGLSDKAVDATQAKYSIAPASAERDAAYKEAQKIVADNATILPLVNVGRTAVVAKSVKGLAFTSDTIARFWTMSAN